MKNYVLESNSTRKSDLVYTQKKKGFLRLEMLVASQIITIKLLNQCPNKTIPIYAVDLC